MDPQKDSTGESMFLGMSLRGLITLILVVFVCVISIFNDDMSETLKYGFSTAIAFFFAQKTNKNDKQ